MSHLDQPTHAHPPRISLARKVGEAFITLIFAAFLTMLIGVLTFVALPLFPRLTWSLAAESVSLIGFALIAATPLLAYAIFESIARLTPRAPAASPHAPTPARSRTRALVAATIAAAFLSVIVGFVIALGRVESHYQSRKRQGVGIYTNPDLAPLVGQCIRLSILRHATLLPDSDERAALESIANDAPARWRASVAQDPSGSLNQRVRTLAAAPAAHFIHQAPTGPRQAASWFGFLREWRNDPRVARMFNKTILAAADSIAADFESAHREALKADFIAADDDSAPLQLDIILRLIADTPTTTAAHNPALSAALNDLATLLADDAKAIAPLNAVITQVRLSTEPHAIAVEANLDRLLADLRTFTALERAAFDLPAADFAREVDRITQGLSDADKYDAFVARGNRYWNTSDLPAAAQWYTLAMALRVDDPAVVERAAHTAFFGSGAPSYVQGLQRAQSWIEQCLATLANQPDACVIDRAHLHAALASNLLYQGRNTDALAPAREALRLFSRVQDAPADQTYYALAHAADALHYANAFTEAAAAADRAVAAAEAFAGPNSGPAAHTYITRASIHLSRGLLKEAEEDISNAIYSAAAASKRDYATLAIAFATRATIRQSRGLLTQAEEDIDWAITWGEAQFPRDKRGLATYYASRASIRQNRGDLDGAAADIKKSITWAETQSPRDERSLATWYADRSRIRRDQQQYPLALADIERSLAWARAQQPIDDWGVALWSGDRATILAEVGRLPEAIADIAAGIDWLRQHRPDSHHLLATDLLYQSRILAQTNNWPAATAAIAEAVPLHESVFGVDHEWTRKARVWQAAINEHRVPPLWLETTP
jgi:hypothetical protein